MDNATHAAHNVAQLLRQIAGQLPHLQPAQLALLGSQLQGAGLELTAQKLEASAPFDPLPKLQKDELWQEQVAMAGDLSRRDIACLWVDGWSEADWRAEWDQWQEQLQEDGEE